MTLPILLLAGATAAASSFQLPYCPRIRREVGGSFKWIVIVNKFINFQLKSPVCLPGGVDSQFLLLDVD